MSCSNPFAPPLGDPHDYWDEQTTVGGLLENFSKAYARKDSLRYTELISCPEFRFNYFDSELGEYSWMPREEDLAVTGAMFRHYNSIDLRWVGLSDDLAVINTIDSLISLTVFFELHMDTDYLSGHARFTVIRDVQDEEICTSPIFENSAVFRIIQWDDDL